MVLGEQILEAERSEAQTDMDAVDVLTNPDTDTEAGAEAAAAEVEALMRTQALESCTYFDNGEEAVKHFTESAEVQALVEARRMSKTTFVRLNKNDDFKRRSHLASLVIAKSKNDSLWAVFCKKRAEERKVRAKIFQKYKMQAEKIARISQKKHIKDMRKMPALPKIKF